MNSSAQRLHLVSKHTFTVNKSYLLYPARDGMYLVRSTNHSEWLDEVVGSMPIFISFPIVGISHWVDRREEKQLEEYDTAHAEGNETVLLQHRKSIHLPLESIDKIVLNAKKNAFTTLFDTGFLSIILKNKTRYTFQFAIYNEHEVIENFINQHFSHITIERIV